MNDNVDDSEKSETFPDARSGQPISDVSGTSLVSGSFQKMDAEGQFSEVFWDNAVNATIRQTHPRVSQLKTELECQYKFEGGRLYVRTLRYKMTTRNGNWNRANIDLYLAARELVERKSPDSLLQDNQWHDYEQLISAPYSPSAEGGQRNRINIRVDYDGTNNDVEPHEGWGGDVYPAAPPVIDNLADGEQVSDTFFVSGFNGLRGGSIRIYLFDKSEELVGETSVFADGTWFSSVQCPAFMEQGYLSAEQKTENQISTRSMPIRIKHYVAPKIDYPAPNHVFLGRPAIKVKGRGAPGREVIVMPPGGAVTHASAKTRIDSTWEGDFNLTNYPDGGHVEMTVSHRGLHDWSLTQSFTLLTVPIIGEPAPASVTDPQGLISGLGVPGAIVEVFKDLNSAIRIGRTEVRADKGWKIDSFENELPPGPFSIVARQSLSSVVTKLSDPRGFKVRPPILENPTVTFPAPQTVKFTGTGHFDAKLITEIQFTVVESSVTPKPDAPENAVVQSGGAWATTVTGWSFGTYKLKVIQKIADNAGGWIGSQEQIVTVNYEMPDVYDLRADADYRPTFSGKGYTGATVMICNPGIVTPPAAPNVPVVGGSWSSRASEIWGPSFKREVHIKQFMGDHFSPAWEKLFVTIPPLAPGLDTIPVTDARPLFSGNCWPRAEVTITFNNDPASYKADVLDDRWSFQRETEFAEGVEHAVTVTQKAAQQTSEATSRTFTLELPLQQPLITVPERDEVEVGNDVMIRGTGAMKGATLQLRDAQYGVDLGPAITLENNGEWIVNLASLAFRRYSIDAQQKLYDRLSERSRLRHFQVVLLPPHIIHPSPGGRLTRAARLQGVGKVGGHVTVFLGGLAEPLVKDIPVVGDDWWSSRWEAEVALPAGPQTLWALQTFMDTGGQLRTSVNSEPQSFDVVPLMPVIETPAPGARIGRRTVVSGFGVAHDTISVKLGEAMQTAEVSSDGTWSVAVQHDLPDGEGVLQVTAQCLGLASDVVERTLVLGSYQPVIEAPAAGRWVSDPVSFAGQGRSGKGQVVSWYDPGVTWTAQLPVSWQGWNGESAVPLPVGANWCRFRQTIGGGTSWLSDWVQSARFEVGDDSDGSV